MPALNTPREQQDGDWIDWSGGECPVDADVMVDVEFRDGFPSDPVPAGRRDWEHWPDGEPERSDGPCSDIIAYRVVRS